ncbi:MAG TPA: AAA family ATPase [Clostridiales bacterium]|nr:AAA family ATPase [Clostridiales bacterium]
MRPKRLEIEGLQSFREKQVIDFETLGETGLFGIFGPTGSGKSTILDAITLALYGRVDRADRGTQGIINANSNRLRVSFTFDLKKGSEVKTYRVERLYSRKKDSDSSTVDMARLIEVTPFGEMPLADKAGDVTAKIEERIGLNHNDFTKAVVLPQNKFQDFLMLNTSDRKKMLERIFYLEEYGQQLNERVKSKLDGLKHGKDIIQNVLNELGDASEEVVKQAEKRLEEAANEKKQAEAQFKACEKKYREAGDLWQLVQDMELLRQQEQQWLAQKDEFENKKDILQKAILAEGLVSMLERNRKTAEELEKTRSELKNVEDVLPEMSEKLKQLEQQYAQIRNTAEKQQPVLMEARTRLVDALSLVKQRETLASKINDITVQWKALNNQIKEKDELISQARARLEKWLEEQSEIREGLAANTVDPEYRQAMQSGSVLESEAGKALEDVQTIAGKIKDQKDKISKLISSKESLSGNADLIRHKMNALMKEFEDHTQKAPGDRNEVLQNMKRLNELQNLQGDLKRAKGDLSRLEGNKSQLCADIQVIEDRRTEARARLENLQKQTETCRQSLDSLIKELDQHRAYLLAGKLVEGQPCPVCGSTHHPRPANLSSNVEASSLEQEISAAQDRLNNAEKELRKAESELLILDEQKRSLEERLDQVAKDIAFAAEEYAKKAEELPAELKFLDPDELKKHLDERRKRDEEVLNAIDAWEQKTKTYQDQQRKLQDDLYKAEAEIGAILAEIKANQDSLDSQEKESKAALEKWQEKKTALEQFHSTWKVESPSKELQLIGEKDKKYRELSDKDSRLQQDIDKEKKNIERLIDEKSELAGKLAALEAEGKSLRQQYNELDERIKQAAPNGNIQEEIEKIDRKLEAFVQAEKQNREQFDELQQQYHQTVTKQSSLIKEKEIYSQQYETEMEELTKAMEEKGFADDLQVRSSVKDKEEQRLLQQEIGEYEQKGVNLQAQRQLLEGRLKGRSITYEEWDQISKDYQEAVEQRDKSLANYELEKSRRTEIVRKHNRWVKWNELKEKISNRIILLTQIFDLLKGDRGKDNSFLDYIAEERLRYVAAKASETLGHITRYKYALELDSEEGFIIRDNGNGGVPRRVSSLSGGETFLTSLSLALALSEQIQLKGQSPLEFFFLDEGFGTLDSELLDMVMDSLERLSTNERVIGLISHVQELRERISRRLVLDPPDSIGRGTRVRIERA